LDKNEQKSIQENFDTNHQIRRSQIGCKLNKSADRTNLKVKWLIIHSFLIAILVKWIPVLIYMNLIFI